MVMVVFYVMMLFKLQKKASVDAEVNLKIVQEKAKTLSEEVK